MRILLASANFRPQVGGIERFTENLAEGLGAAGHEITVLAARSQGAPLQEETNGYRVVRVPATYVLHRYLGVPYPLPRPDALRRAVRSLVRSSDVVHVQDALYLTSGAVLRSASSLGVPSVLTQHVSFVPQRHRWLDLVQHAAVDTLGRVAGRASSVVTLNPSVAQWARERWGVEAKVLPVGVPTPPSLGPTERSAVRERHGLPADRPVMVFVGRDVPKKGLDILLAAASPEYVIAAVTDRRAESTADVRFLPFMPPGEVQQVIGSSDAFVLPSEGEGFPVVLQEALVQGVAVVSTRCDGYEHYLREDEVMWIERTPDSVRNALRELAASPERTAGLRDAARAAGRREFGMETFVGAYLDEYARLLAA